MRAVGGVVRLRPARERAQEGPQSVSEIVTNVQHGEQSRASRPWDDRPTTALPSAKAPGDLYSGSSRSDSLSLSTVVPGAAMQPDLSYSKRGERW